MITNIASCRKCNLCEIQSPVLDTPESCQVMWVGLSAKIVSQKDKIPLSANTVTGTIVQTVEQKFPQILFYKTNLVKCAPLNEEGKLRYPTNAEIDTCITHLDNELQMLCPNLVFLLGKRVSETVCSHLCMPWVQWDGYKYHDVKHNNTTFVSIHHPSYIYVYRRNEIGHYIDSISHIIESFIAQK